MVLYPNSMENDKFLMAVSPVWIASMSNVNYVQNGGTIADRVK